MPRLSPLPLLAAGLLGCAGGGAVTPPQPDGGAPPTSDWCKQYDCTNAADAVLVPLLGEHQLLPATVEDSGILCRRMAIDLTGLPPTRAEIDGHCTNKTPAQIADYFMAKPTGANAPDGSAPYVYVNRRLWADAFQYQVGLGAGVNRTFYSYIVDLDALVGELYAGRIRYDEFARRALASPAFARRFGIFEANHDLVQIASQAYRIFLGREALPSEAEDFGNLWRAWSTRPMGEELSRNLYPECTFQCGAMIGGGRRGECICGHTELGLDGTACSGNDLAACQSVILGAGVVAPSLPGFVRFADLSPMDRYAIETPGRLIAAQPEFAEAAVDRALARYLGWWKAGFYRPDFDLPSVRDALVRKFVADGFDVRKLDREIVTSLLYTQRSALGAGQKQIDPYPIWAYGPTKQLYAEAWLDAVGQATGRNLGGCDFRFQNDETYLYTYPRHFTWTPWSGVAGNRYYYSSQALDLGGCPAASTHGSPSGLVPAIRRRAVLAQVCPGAFAPAAPEALVKGEFASLGRDPLAVEAQIWTGHLKSCDATVESCKPQDLADKLCVSLFASAPLNYY